MRATLATAGVSVLLSACGSASTAGTTPPPGTGREGASSGGASVISASDIPPSGSGGYYPGGVLSSREEASSFATQAWSRNAVEHRGRVGARVEYPCPGPGVEGRVWGTDSYSDDSSVCTAAVHAGQITLEAGGSVTIQIGPAAQSFHGSRRNGVTSTDYGAWPGSYSFP